MKVQRVDALVEEIAVRLPKQAVPPRKGERWLGRSVEEECLRTTPSLARGVRPESSRDAMTLGHGRSPDRSEAKEGTRTRPGRPKHDEKHPRRRPEDPGQASNKGAVSR